MRSALRDPYKPATTRGTQRRITFQENKVLISESAQGSDALSLDKKKSLGPLNTKEGAKASSKFKSKYSAAIPQNKGPPSQSTKPVAEREDSATSKLFNFRRTNQKHASYPKVNSGNRNARAPKGRNELYQGMKDLKNWQESSDDKSKGEKSIERELLQEILHPRGDENNLLYYALAYKLDKEQELDKKVKKPALTLSRRTSDKSMNIKIEDKTLIKMNNLSNPLKDKSPGTGKETPLETFIHSGLPSIRLTTNLEEVERNIENVSKPLVQQEVSYMLSHRPVTKSLHKSDDLKHFNQNKAYEKIDYRKLEILEFLGKGSFGQVYKAFYNPMGKFVALKFYELSQEREREVLEDAQNEKIIMEKLNELKHPNFVEFYSIYEENKLDSGKRFVVIMMEYGICSMSDLLLSGIY